MEKNKSAEELPENRNMAVSESASGATVSADADAKNEAADERETPPKGSKEEAYEWLIRHHVTARVMDIVIAVCLILLVIVVVLGMK